MARTYPYCYKGTLRMKQDKCKTSMPLDRARVWLDFNELCSVDGENGAPVYLFSQADLVNDAYGADVELCEGMRVSVFDEDLGGQGRPDALLADGIVIRNRMVQYPRVKWLIQLTKNSVRYQSCEDYVYWMSDLRQI